MPTVETQGTLHFSVDSALLREIGERLVGKPFIALAELVKNSYDADARKAIITIDPIKDKIIVRDNGHGMTLDEFKVFWMRIGSTHKVSQRVSRNFHRLMTGSKGIGRLAVQYLAEEMILFTTSESNLNERLKAKIRWEKAIKAGELVNATVDYQILTNEDFKQGTTIILKGLKQAWGDEKPIQGLANEIWWLQPPFENINVDPKKRFLIKFKSESGDLQKAFNRRIKVAMNLWNARIIGKNVRGHVSLSLEFKGKEPMKHEYDVPNCSLIGGSWEVRVYLWEGHQLYKIKVGEARDYFNDWGGVHLYDKGFRLPYYGDPNNDWLKIEQDHSHRLTLSKIVPPEWNIPNGMQMLPTMSRLFGVVNVETLREPDLEIALTRDRLQESKALNDLREMVRFGLDWYAIEEKKRSIQDKPQTSLLSRTKSVEDVLTEYKPKIQREVYRDLKAKIEKANEDNKSEAERITEQVGLVGSLATAGIASVSYQHELKRQFRIVEEILKSIDNIETKDEAVKKQLIKIREDLQSWLQSAKATNSLFSYFSDTANVQTKKRFLARKTLEEISEQLKPLARGVPVIVGEVAEDLLLPEASLVEWSAVFQNVIVNAFNATLDSEKKLIKVISRTTGADREILVEDTGCGVDLKKADQLFKPFMRKMVISPERQALGYGGMGLGLTIVKLVANNIGCEVSFVEPDEGFSTAFSLKWRESK
jgi:signal transduction histidine kinase